MERKGGRWGHNVESKTVVQWDGGEKMEGSRGIVVSTSACHAVDR